MEINKPRRPVLLSVSVVSEPATVPVANGLLSTNDRFVKEVCRYIICSLRHIHTCTSTIGICGCMCGNYHSFGRYLSHRIHNNNIAESLYNVCLYDVCMYECYTIRLPIVYLQMQYVQMYGCFTCSTSLFSLAIPLSPSPLFSLVICFGLSLSLSANYVVYLLLF